MTRFMKIFRLTFIVGIFFLYVRVNAQIKSDSLMISGEIPSLIKNKNEFLLKIFFTNLGNKNLNVYESLEEGRTEDLQRNFNIIIEKETKRKFEPYQTRIYHYGIDHDDTTYRDVPRKELAPGQERVLTYNINTLTSFAKGRYRLKFGIRTKAVKYGEGSKYYNISYEYSPNWIYFTVNDNFARNDSLMFIN